MSFFRIIVPTFNNQSTLARALESIRRQTFIDYDLIVVDDKSDDQRAVHEIIEAFETIVTVVLYLDKKRYSGGARNEALHYYQDDEYTLFLDADDEFVDESVLESLYHFIEQNDWPDMVRLPYIRKNEDGTKSPKTMANERGLEDTARNVRVACWTKAVRSKLVQPFPENTLMEDAVQHLRQCDACESWARLPRFVVQWNRSANSTSNANSAKWQSSAYRFVADLMDYEPAKSFTEERRDQKLAEALKNLAEGKFLQ
jgi:glycosyltransferase involved in cell wall biosynthesis